MQYQLLADAVLLVHFGVVVFVIGGLVVVVAGNARGWCWVNGWLFRLAHLAAIGVVVVQSWLGRFCPLTTLESWLRVQAGSPSYATSFVQHWVQRIIFHEAPNWVFTVAYTAFGFLVLVAWWRFPPRRSKRSNEGGAAYQLPDHHQQCRGGPGAREGLKQPRQSGSAEEKGMAKGECNCGAVQFDIDADLSGVFVCHCSICRRSTGSNGIAVVVVPKERFRWVQGEECIATWKKPNTDWQTWFCSICGSPVPGENDPTRMFVPAGSITHGGDALRVIHHIWVGSKAVWDEIGDGGKQHTEEFRG